jgi:RluA family pseudouridine synthase
MALHRALAVKDPSRPWETLIHAGHVLVFGRFIGAGYQVKAGDVVTWQDLVVEPEVCAGWKILWRDEHYLAIDKPANLPVHPTGAYREHCLVRMLENSVGPVFPLHRLDRETSGVLIFGLHYEAARRGHLSFHANRKTYLAGVHGDFPKRLLVESALGKKKDSRVRIRQGPDPSGQAALTRFARVRSGGGVSLVMAWPETGRKHQIRSHLVESGFPVVGDKIYGLDESFFIDFTEGKLGIEAKNRLILDRHFLHCWKIRFRHPILNTMVVLKSPLPHELTRVLEKRNP